MPAMKTRLLAVSFDDTTIFECLCNMIFEKNSANQRLLAKVKLQGKGATFFAGKQTLQYQVIVIISI
jgi:hypothetical protein